MTDSTSTLYWSRAPGKFVDKLTGQTPVPTTAQPWIFHGTVRNWYETLVEVIVDGANTLYRRNYQQALIVSASANLYDFILCHVPQFKPIGETDIRVTGKPAWLPGTVKGTLLNMTVLLDDKLPTNEAKVLLVTDHLCIVRPGIPSDPPKMITIGGELMQAPVLPEVDIVILPEAKVIDEITVHVLDLNVL